MINVKVVDTEGNVLLSKEMSLKHTILDLKEQLQQNHPPAGKSNPLLTCIASLSTRRVGLFLGDSKGRELFEHGKNLGAVTKTSEGLLVTYKDLGPVVSQHLVYNAAYTGPTAMVLLFYFGSKQVYGVEQSFTINQKVGALVAFLHYFRRVIESNFVHVFTEQPLPWVAVPGIMFYYWFLFGFCVAYFFLMPGYSPWFQMSESVTIALGCLFMLFESLNFRCHCITAGLRKPGSNERGIPQGCGFGIVTVTNYMWEGFAWTTFIPIAQTWGSVMFMFASWLAMYSRGKEKHQKYIEQAPDYARGKKILIPYIL